MLNITNLLYKLKRSGLRSVVLLIPDITTSTDLAVLILETVDWSPHPLVSYHGELPSIWVSVVRCSTGKILFTPTEHALLVVRGAVDSEEMQFLSHRSRGDLHVCPSVWPMPQGTEGVGSILGVQVVSGRDGVFSTVWRSAVAAREGVVLEVVVPHQLYHGPDVSHRTVVSLEDQGSRGPVVREPVSVTLHHCWNAAAIKNLLVEGHVVAGPVGLSSQH